MDQECDRGGAEVYADRVAEIGELKFAIR